jgi:hypothetical protein
MCEQPTWCKMQTIPSGVAAGDYQCLDFDQGPFPPSGWAPFVTAPGSMTTTNTRFNSSPNSFDSSCPLQVGRADARATINWTGPSGGQNLSSLSLSAMMSPVTPTFAMPWSDNLDLLCLAISNEWSFACLSYTYGNASVPWQTAPYTGLFIRFQFTVDDFVVFNDCPVSASFGTNLWTKAELRINNATGMVEAIIDGATTSCPSSHPPAPTSAPFAWVGSKQAAFAVSGTNSDWRTYFDNVVVTVRR